MDGLKFVFSQGQLIALLKEKVEYHRQRAETKQKELPKLIETFEKMKEGVDLTNPSHLNKTQTYKMTPEDVIENVEHEIQHHQKRATALAFLAEHVANEQYVLSTDDLVRLDILKW